MHFDKTLCIDSWNMLSSTKVPVRLTYDFQSSKHSVILRREGLVTYRINWWVQVGQLALKAARVLRCNFLYLLYSRSFVHGASQPIDYYILTAAEQENCNVSDSSKSSEKVAEC